jgi:hypothetical protein
VTVSITLKETKSVTEANLYSVKQEITASDDISDSIFVFNTTDETYAHVATVYDMENIASESKAAAETAGEDHYRLAAVTKEWATLDLATEFSAYNQARVQWLIDEYSVYTTTFAGVTTTIFTSAT